MGNNAVIVITLCVTLTSNILRARASGSPFTSRSLLTPTLSSHLMFMHAQLSNVVGHTIVNVDCLSKAPSALANQKIIPPVTGTHEHTELCVSHKRLRTK